MPNYPILDFLTVSDMLNIAQCAQNRINLAFLEQRPDRAEYQIRELSTVKLYADMISSKLAWLDSIQ